MSVEQLNIQRGENAAFWHHSLTNYRNCALKPCITVKHTPTDCACFSWSSVESSLHRTYGF